MSARQPFPTIFLTVRDSHLSHKVITTNEKQKSLTLHTCFSHLYYSAMMKGEMIFNEVWLCYGTVPYK